MASAVRIKRDLERMISALEGQLLGAEMLASSVENSLKAETFGAYQSFRYKVDELRSLSVLIEERFKYLLEENVDLLRQQFELLDVLLLTMIIRCYRQFFSILSECQALPLGAHEIFSPELDILDDTRERLSRPVYADQIAEELRVDLEFAVEAIRAVIGRAEPLPDFSFMAKNPDMEEDQGARLLH
ncbi:MAG: hypothetical protein WCO00_12760 [Rhodospirillaceae bacterium]